MEKVKEHIVKILVGKGWLPSEAEQEAQAVLFYWDLHEEVKQKMLDDMLR